MEGGGESVINMIHICIWYKDVRGWGLRSLAGGYRHRGSTAQHTCPFCRETEET